MFIFLDICGGLVYLITIVNAVGFVFSSFFAKCFCMAKSQPA